MARMYKPKYPKVRLVRGPDDAPVLETRIATRGPNKGKSIRVPKRVSVRGADGKLIYVESKKWAIDYYDANGGRRTVGAYTDKVATKQKS